MIQIVGYEKIDHDCINILSTQHAILSLDQHAIYIRRVWDNVCTIRHWVLTAFLNKQYGDRRDKSCPKSMNDVSNDLLVVIVEYLKRHTGGCIVLSNSVSPDFCSSWDIFWQVLWCWVPGTHLKYALFKPGHRGFRKC